NGADVALLRVDSRACDDVTSTRSRDCNNEFADSERGRGAEFGTVLSNLLINPQQSDISPIRSSRKLRSSRMARSRNDGDLSALPDGMPGGQNKIGPPQNPAGCVPGTAIDGNDRLARMRDTFRNLFRELMPCALHLSFSCAQDEAERRTAHQPNG